MSKSLLLLLIMTMFIHQVPLSLSQGISCLNSSFKDVVFVIDTSRSIGGGNRFQLIRDFTANITTDLINNSLRSAVGVILFSTTANIEFNLTAHTNLSALKSAINNLNFSRGNPTNISKALRLLSLTAQNGDLGLRNDSSKIAIVITDGQSGNMQGVSMAAMELHSLNLLDVYVVGIGMEHHRQLREIASSPELVFIANDITHDDLQPLKPEILKQLRTGVVVSLKQPQHFIQENCSSISAIGIHLNRNTYEDVIVEVTISNGSAHAGVDYNISDGSANVFNVTISAGSTSSSFSIDIINDMIQEDNETFNITITLLPSCLSLSLGTSSSTVKIIDDDVALITFTSSTYSGLESSGVISATIVISGGIVSGKDINITVTFTEGTASASDFNSTMQVVIIAAGTNNSEVNISVTNDNIVEGNETFNMNLSVPSVPSLLSPEITIGTITSATVTIIDISRVCTNLWKLLEMKEVTNCSTYNYTKIETLMNESCKADSLSELVEKLTAALVMLTKPKEDNISACRTDLIKIVQLLEFIVNTTENNPGILSSQNIIQNTADIFSNILSPLNTPGWMELQKINPPFNQKVLLLSERFGFILADEDRSIASDNLLITTKLVNSSSTDVSCNGTGIGLNNSISIPAEFIQERSDITGKTSIPIVTIHYKNIQNILPISTANSTPRFQPVSQVLSSQVTNISDTSSNSAVNLTLQYSLNSSVNLTLTCGFWNFSLNGESGGWDISSVQIIMNDTDNSIITCNSSHLTSFAVLVDTLGGYKDLSDQERRALSIISYIGCIISLFSLLIAIILLIYYRNTLLNGIHSFIHLNLAIALFLALIIFVSGIEAASENDVGCTIVASLLHYFFTAVFTWMLCEGIMLYFLLVKVFNTGLGQRKLFYFTIGWGIPIPIVAISVGVAHDQYGHEEYCWIDYEEGAIWAFVGPMIVIIILNILFLLLALRSLYMIKRSKLESSQAVFVRTILKATVILLPLLGITWVVGILAVNQESSVFAWIFTILNSLQGFFILVFHVIRNEKIWHKISSSWKDNRYRFIIPSSKQTPIDSRITKIKESISTTSNADTKQDADVNTKQEVNIKQEEEVATTTAFLMDITVPSSNNETDL